MGDSAHGGAAAVVSDLPSERVAAHGEELGAVVKLEAAGIASCHPAANPARFFEDGDIVIDGGNSLYTDTDRRAERAADEFEVLAPLLDAGFTKADVREFASARGLAVSDKPASACLASRIPTGSEVTARKLGQVERAESALRSLGFRQLRVRHHGAVARVEFDPEGRLAYACRPNALRRAFSNLVENAARYAREAPSTALYNLACAYALTGHTDEALEALAGSREAGFDIVVASEIMAIFCLSSDLADFEERVDRIVLGTRPDGSFARAGDLNIGGAMALLMRDALAPNLVQTIEGGPALIHGGPFANIAHGCNSLAATRAGLALGDVVVTEAGFGADLGAEKFFDIKCRIAGLQPKASLLHRQAGKQELLAEHVVVVPG